jgi:hypothetical protein
MNPSPNIVAVFAATRGVLIAVGAIMVYMKLGDTHAYALVMQAAGSIMVAGPMAWAVFEKLVTLKKTIAAAVQAGINLTASGSALAEDGSVVDKNDGSTPPKAVTVKTAQEIVKDFAPSPKSIAKE